MWMEGLAAGGAPKEILADPRVQAVKERESKAKEQEAHVRPERLLPVFQQPKLILVTAATEDYRRLARSQVSSSDVVLELGCSYGMATNMLAEHAAAVVGIDNSEEAVAQARKRYPHVRQQGFVKNPLRYPQRFTADGTRICRPHNYDKCLKIATCGFDHVHCHHCGAAGHRAVNCHITA
ncbi:hypothetical protein OEZ86_003289 [Tetradesmus obliquus]|nr:hypothetical protein OEZ86_003289 [Tetradesmus obliquus]